MEHFQLTLDMIAAELEENVTNKFLDCFASNRSSIPDLPSPTAALRSTVGDDAARILSGRLGGSAIDVPTPSEHRRIEIARLWREGESRAEIARQIGCLKATSAMCLPNGTISRHVLETNPQAALYRRWLANSRLSRHPGSL
jgi:hypothetical protein